MWGWIVAAIVAVASALFIFFWVRKTNTRDEAEIADRVAHLKAEQFQEWKKESEATLKAELATLINRLREIQPEIAYAQKLLEELQKQCDQWATQGRASREDYENFNKMVWKLRDSCVKSAKNEYEEMAKRLDLRRTLSEKDFEAWTIAHNKMRAENELIYEEMVAHLRAVQEVRNRDVHEAEDGVLRMRLVDEAIAELRELWSAIKRLRVANPTPLYKAVFELYLRGAVKELMKGAPEGGGIYRITDKVDGKVYVGRTTNFANRWLEHVKRGANYEEGTAAGSLLYGAMKEHGVWNFTFEALEVADEGFDYGEREKEWIRILGSDKDGLNMRRG